MIELKDIYKIYSDGDSEIRALDGINLKISEGEFVAIVGQSGSGKSTCMNIIGCLDVPTSGSYHLNGIDVSTMKDDELAVVRNQTLGFIFQQYNLIPSLTALENVMLPLTIQGVSKKTRIARSKAILEKLGLGKRLNNKPSQMSGGQQQRVSIARSLVSNPKIIFADEPTGNLDSKTTVEILEFMQSIVREEQRTLIMVSHDTEVAMYADRIVHMLDGRITGIEEISANIAKTAAKERTQAYEE